MLAIANHIQIFHVPEHIFEKDLLCIITEYRLSHPATSANGIRAIQLWNTETWLSLRFLMIKQTKLLLRCNT